MFTRDKEEHYLSVQDSIQDNLTITVDPWITQGLECQPPT